MYDHAKELICPEASSSDSSPDALNCPDILPFDPCPVVNDRCTRLENLLKQLRMHWNQHYNEYSNSTTAEMMDPLIFWRTSEISKDMTDLHPYIRAVLATPSSSSISETIFSLSGALKTKSRSAMKPEKLAVMTFFKFNINLFATTDELVDKAYRYMMPSSPEQVVHDTHQVVSHLT